jgi:hypothetical protein
MSASTPARRQRDLTFFRDPKRWSCWPFLPVVRRLPTGEQQLGVLYDALGHAGVYGYSATVLLVNLFLLPPTVEELLALPRLVYDAPEEIAEAGWSVD